MAREPAANRQMDWSGLGVAVGLTLVIIFPLVVVGTWAFTNVWRYPAIIPQEFGLRFWNQTLANLKQLVEAPEEKT